MKIEVFRMLYFQ